MSYLLTLNAFFFLVLWLPVIILTTFSKDIWKAID